MNHQGTELSTKTSPQRLHTFVYLTFLKGKYYKNGEPIGCQTNERLVIGGKCAIK
jgi:hypothetical protein